MPPSTSSTGTVAATAGATIRFRTKKKTAPTAQKPAVMRALTKARRRAWSRSSGVGGRASVSHGRSRSASPRAQRRPSGSVTTMYATSAIPFTRMSCPLSTWFWLTGSRSAPNTNRSRAPDRFAEMPDHPSRRSIWSRSSPPSLARMYELSLTPRRLTKGRRGYERPRTDTPSGGEEIAPLGKDRQAGHRRGGRHHRRRDRAPPARRERLERDRVRDLRRGSLARRAVQGCLLAQRREGPDRGELRSGRGGLRDRRGPDLTRARGHGRRRPCDAPAARGRRLAKTGAQSGLRRRRGR